MGQGEVIEFLKKYKQGKPFKKKPWLTVREIYEKMKGTRNASELGSVTNSCKKLRESGMIKFKEMESDRANRKVFHYQSK
jgi:Fe2+ or Zn2+ uptake regulation protein